MGSRKRYWDIGILGYWDIRILDVLCLDIIYKKIINAARKKSDMRSQGLAPSPKERAGGEVN
jgi:hypothetical protein